MIFIKKYFSLFLILVIIACLQIAVFGATKQELLDELRTSVTIGDVTRTLPEQYVKQFAEMLNRNEYTTEQLDEIMGYIKEGKDYWISTGQPAFSKLQPDQQGKLMSIFNKVAQVLELKVSTKIETEVAQPAPETPAPETPTPETPAPETPEPPAPEPQAKTSIKIDIVDNSNNKYSVSNDQKNTGPIKTTGMALDYRPALACFFIILILFLCSSVYIVLLKVKGRVL